METKVSKYPEGVRFSYLRDGSNPNRVLTIARVCKKGSDTVKFGWSVNCPTSWRRTEGRETVTLQKVKGDQFSRKSGREKALARMADAPLVATLEKNEIPLHGALAYLVREGSRLELPYHVSEVAEQHWNEVPKYCDWAETKEEPIKHKRNFLDQLMSMLRGV